MDLKAFPLQGFIKEEQPMVKIYGVTIKNLLWFRDHEGCEIAQGDIWKGKEELGFWSQDARGGNSIMEFPDRKLTAEVEKFKNSVHFAGMLDREAPADNEHFREQVFKFFDAELLIDEVLIRTETEKMYRKTCRKHSVKTCVALLHGMEITMYPIRTDMPDEELKKSPFIQKDLKDKGYGQLLVIRKPSDLSIS